MTEIDSRNMSIALGVLGVFLLLLTMHDLLTTIFSIRRLTHLPVDASSYRRSGLLTTLICHIHSKANLRYLITLGLLLKYLNEAETVRKYLSRMDAQRLDLDIPHLLFRSWEPFIVDPFRLVLLYRSFKYHLYSFDVQERVSWRSEPVISSLSPRFHGSIPSFCQDSVSFCFHWLEHVRHLFPLLNPDS